MRDYVLNEVYSRQAYGRLTLAARILKNWRAQTALRKLANHEDYLLRDVGLTRADIDRLLAYPLTADVEWESERLALLAGR